MTENHVNVFLEMIRQLFIQGFSLDNQSLFARVSDFIICKKFIKITGQEFRDPPRAMLSTSGRPANS